MRIGQFELSIIGQDGTKRAATAEGHVPMAHGEQYAIEFRNHGGDHVNLYCVVDGVSIGDFQIGPYETRGLERPLGGRGRFTFFAAGSGEAASAGEAAVDRADKGLVQVTFAPGRERAVGFLRSDAPGPWAGPPEARCLSPGTGHTGTVGALAMMDFGAGVTGQTGYSGQEFGVGRSIVEDAARRVVITLRLVHDRALSLPGAVRPLPGRAASNPIPRPVG